MSKVTGSGKNTPPEDLATASRTLEDFRFRMLIENSRDGITLLDKNLSIIYRSSSAERINGWSDAARGAKSLNDLIHPEDREKFVKDRVLEYSHLSSLSRLPDEAENYTFIRFTLQPDDDHTLLELDLSNFPSESHYKHIDFYWSVTLEVLKRFVEERYPRRT